MAVVDNALSIARPPIRPKNHRRPALDAGLGYQALSMAGKRRLCRFKAHAFQLPIADVPSRWHHRIMDILIVQRPIGDAPEWVREAWIGLTIPLATENQGTWRTMSVLASPHHWLGRLWAVVSGKSTNVTGYMVSAKIAVDLLADHSPNAAAWWREHTPKMLDGNCCFVFDAAACKRESC